MVVFKRKKNKRMRGAKTTHGFGSKKKNRGAGNRGGKGMAGTGKRADQKKPTIINLYGNSYYGKKGFKRPQEVQSHIKAINIEYLDSHLTHFVTQGLVTKEGDSFVVDLEKLGYQKLLGKGKMRHKVKVRAPSVSASAMSKIQESGGEVQTQDVSTK